MNKSAWLLIGLFLIYSCKKTKLKGDLSFFVGTWEWKYCVKTVDLCQYFPYDSLITATPSSKGFTYSLTFEEKGKLIVKKNGKIEHRYRLVFDSKDVGPDQVIYYFYLDNRKKKYMSFDVYHHWPNFFTTQYFPEEFQDDIKEGCEDTHSIFEKN